ncbi:hypothetical protein YC2023_122219 [Brassica napus]
MFIVLYFGLICKEVAKVVPAQTLADQELTETMQKLLIVMQRLDDKIGLMLESDGELFNKSFWDKRYLMRQIEKYGYLFSAFSEQLVVYLSNFLLSKLVSGISADIYTSRVSNFLNYTPFMYFRSQEQVKKLGRVPLINCAKTSMSSKLISGDRDFFANLDVDAVLSVKMTNQRGEIKYPIKDDILIVKHFLLTYLIGDQYSESSWTKCARQLFVERICAQYWQRCPGMPLRVSPAKIACLDFNLQKTKMQLGVQVVVNDPRELEKIRQKFLLHNLDIRSGVCKDYM